MTKDRPILCLDFDGVLHAYTSGWQGIDVIPDGPVAGAINFLVDATRCFSVSVVSSRSEALRGRLAMAQAIDQWVRAELSPDEAGAVLANITFPEHKPPALVTIDDRAITFTGTFPAVKELLAFRPWNTKPKSKMTANVQG